MQQIKRSERDGDCCVSPSEHLSVSLNGSPFQDSALSKLTFVLTGNHRGTTLSTFWSEKIIICG